MKKQLSAAAALAIAAPMTFGLGAAPAQAAEIQDAIKSVTVTGQATAPGDVLTVEASWSVPDGSQPGDTFTLPLPAALQAMQTAFPLAASDGTVIANASVVDGLVVVTLSDAVADRPLNISGGMRFNAVVSESATPGEQIVLEWGGAVSQPLTVTEKAGPGPEDNERTQKWGRTTADGGNGWGVKITGEKSGVVFTDTPQDHKIQCDSVKVTLADFDGASYSGWRDAGGSLSCDAGVLNYSVGHIPSGSAVFVEYSVSGEGLDSDGDGVLQNNWHLTADGGMTDGGSVSHTAFSAGGWGDGENRPVVEEPAVEEPTVEPTPEPTPEPTEEPAVEEPVVEPTPEPTVEPDVCGDIHSEIRESVVDGDGNQTHGRVSATTLTGSGEGCEVAPEPTPEPTEEPTVEPTPEPEVTPEPTPEPEVTPEPEPTEEPTPEPTEEPTVAPVVEETEAPAETPITVVTEKETIQVTKVVEVQDRVVIVNTVEEKTVEIPVEKIQEVAVSDDAPQAAKVAADEIRINAGIDQSQRADKAAIIAGTAAALLAMGTAVAAARRVSKD